MTCEWYNPASYGDCVGHLAKSAAGDAFQSIAQSFGQAADHAVSWLWAEINLATAVRLGGPGFDLELGIMAAIAGTVAVALFAIQIIQSVLRREPAGLARAAKGLVVAFIAGGAAIAVVNLLLGATDSLCSGIVKLATGTNITGLGRLVLAPGALTSTVYGSAALLLLSLGCIVAAVIVYVALVVRKVLIVVTAVFAPLAFAGSLADITVSWTRRWIETTIALITSKLILTLIFVAGYDILVEGAGEAGSGAAQKVTQVISGVLVLFCAGFAPWLALKVVHFTGDHAHQLHSLGSSAVGGATASGRMAQMATPYAWRFGAPGRAAAATNGSALKGQAVGTSGAFTQPEGAPGGNGTPGRPGGQGGPGGTADPASHGPGQGGTATSSPAPSSAASTQRGGTSPTNAAPSSMSQPATSGAPTSPPGTDRPSWPPRQPPASSQAGSTP
jgi:type IV secretion system protein TrbL